MYQVYQVILVEDDTEVVNSEWQTMARAVSEAAQLENDAGDGQHYIVLPFTRGL